MFRHRVFLCSSYAILMRLGGTAVYSRLQNLVLKPSIRRINSSNLTRDQRFPSNHIF